MTKLYNKYPCTILEDKGQYVKVELLEPSRFDYNKEGKAEWTYPKRDVDNEKNKTGT